MASTRRPAPDPTNQVDEGAPSAPLEGHGALRLVPLREDKDRELVHKIRAGDADAFERAFRTYFSPLCVVVNGYVLSPDVAEELVQDLLLALWDRRAQLDVRESLRVYLFRAARNRALNHVRRAGREIAWGRAAATAESPLHGDGAPYEAQEAMESLELQGAIDAAIAALPERRRLAFQLTQQVDLSRMEAAAVMGIAPKTVAIHLGLARAELRSRLKAFLEA